MDSTIPATQSRRPDQLGVTLVELMIAAGVVVPALVLVAGSLLSVHQTRALVATKSAAVSHLNTVLNELQQASEEELLGYVPPQTVAGATVATDISYRLGNGVVLRPPVAVSALPENVLIPDPVRVRVRVTVTTATGRPLTLQTTTFVRP